MSYCSVEACNKASKCRGWCNPHYQIWKKHGNPNYPVRKREYHGLEHIAEYGIWLGIKQRCYNPKRQSYKYYGKRGLGMSQPWLNSFIQFYKDMGPRPSKIHSIDRINNDIGYQADNCKWSTPLEQSRNRRPYGKNKIS